MPIYWYDVFCDVGVTAVVAFPNSPDENFSQKVNKKMYRAAMASIWSKLIADEAYLYCVVESFTVEIPEARRLLPRRLQDDGCAERNFFSLLALKNSPTTSSSLPAI